ncbi:hypothetical protein GCM10027174_24020 [Salinifilum aidingensis]
MTTYALPARIAAAEAVDLCARRAPRAQVGTAELHHHPFVAVAFDVVRRSSPRRRRRTAPAQRTRVHTLVDAVGGRAHLTDPWPELESHATIRGPEGVITTAEAVRRATEAVSAQLLRTRRLLDPGSLREARIVERVWKPNWVLTVVHRGRAVQVLVDGLNGSHYVAGEVRSSAQSRAPGRSRWWAR